jgi:hypothetical protein
METRRRITEEDLLITEKLIAESYGQLKQSVIQAPTRAFRSAGQTVRQHPYATAGVAIIAGVALYGIFKMVTSSPPYQEAPGRAESGMKTGAGRPDLMQQMLPTLIPLVAPYIGSFIQKYLGKILSGERG